MLLTGKTAAISGAASKRGIGFATARRFAAEGARVAILDIDSAGAAEAAASLGAGHLGIACDVSSKAHRQNKTPFAPIEAPSRGSRCLRSVVDLACKVDINSTIGKLFLFARGESIFGGTVEMQ